MGGAALNGSCLMNNESNTIDDGFIDYCIEHAVSSLFNEYSFGVVTCDERSTCIMKLMEEYYMFDSHARGEDGLCDGKNGKAVLLKFKDMDRLTAHIKLVNNNCLLDFEIIPIVIVQKSCENKNTQVTHFTSCNKSNSMQSNISSSNTSNSIVESTPCNKGSWLAVNRNKKRSKKILNFQISKKVKCSNQFEVLNEISDNEMTNDTFIGKNNTRNVKKSKYQKDKE
jgi:hypothetical protein